MYLHNKLTVYKKRFQHHGSPLMLQEMLGFDWIITDVIWQYGN